MKSGYIKLFRNIMEERRFLVTYSFTVYNQGYSAFANDEIVLNKKKIKDERDIPFLLKYEIQKIKIFEDYDKRKKIREYSRVFECSA